MIYLLIVCLIIIGFLGYKLSKKIKIDNTKLDKVKQDLAVYCQLVETLKEIVRQKLMELYQLEEKTKTAKEATEYEKYKLEECKKDLQAALDVYQDITDNRLKEINDLMEELRKKRQEDLDKSLNETKEKYEFMKEKAIKECMDELDSCWRERDQLKILADNEIILYKTAVDELKIQYESLLEPLKLYEKERQERLFYTILLPEEYQPDIEFLLTTVAAKVQHPDIISKLVWTEYVKPNLDNTFKRIEIKPEPGIYKLTSLENGMAYIGKSTDVKKRIADHFKSAIGLTTISDLLVHHVIRKEGFWNWTIEIITYCDKEKLGELEKYYIEFFKTQEFGYNKRAGG